MSSRQSSLFDLSGLNKSPSAGHPPFDGETYEPAVDGLRLGTLLADVFTVMQDRRWRTLAEIHRDIDGRGTEASISARLRDLRKEKFGGMTVERRRRGEPRRGLWEYQLSRLGQS